MIINKDCLEALKTLPENSVDSIVTDPPYHLVSIVKRFGKENSAPAKFGTDGAFSRASKGFMGKDWDGVDETGLGIAQKVELWKECLRVLKPGGYLLAFSGTRTTHRMTVAIEDAGFEIRDMIAWVYSTGFPKSLNIYKQLQKNCNCGNMEVYDNERTKEISKHNLRPLQQTDLSKTKPFDKEQGEVLQSSLQEQSAYSQGEEAVAMLQFSERTKQSSMERGADLQATEGELQGGDLPEMPARVFTNGEEGRIHNATQTGDGSTFETTIDENGGGAPQRPQSEQQQDREPCAFCKQWGTQKVRETAGKEYGFGTALKPALEPITVARKPIEGTVAENCLKYGVGGINIDGSRVEAQGETMSRPFNEINEENVWNSDNSGYKKRGNPNNISDQLGRFPANLIHDGSEEVLELFPDTKTNSTGKNSPADYQTKSVFGAGYKSGALPYEGDSGSAARFFMACKYTPNDAILKLCENNLSVNNAEYNLPITSLIESVVKISSVLKNATPNLDLLNQNLNVLFAEKIPKNTAIDFVAKLVAMSEAPEGLVSQEELQVIRDFIINCRNYTQNQNNVSAEKLENIDITQITINLLKLCGYVLLVIDENTNSERKEAVEVNGEPKRFLYQAKASKSERGTDNKHPTVKPIKLMEYLVNLVSKEGHTVLDPFAGSGTTGIACKKLNRNFIGVERDPEYCKIAEARINAI